ncbi:MAG: rhomboid family intramembrane serine protease [Wenzhouxiangellaceae bacterium]|nr:rhomboid family intramembrane serine protease [Wenzhouxiangellaceae bacterium]
MSVLVRSSTRRAGAVHPWMVIGTSLLMLIMLLSHAALAPEARQFWIDFWGFQPSMIAVMLQAPVNQWHDVGLLNLVSASFVHSNWLHLAGNLAYFWVFGIAVERGIGHIRFIALFVILGAFANLFVALRVPELERAIIGASGGVSAVIGAYLGLFPTRRIGLWLPLGLFLQFARIPALLVIGSWFTLQLLYTVFGPMTGAVAWWTHVAGFIAGLLAAIALRAVSGRLDLQHLD